MIVIVKSRAMQTTLHHRRDIILLNRLTNCHIRKLAGILDLRVLDYERVGSPGENLNVIMEDGSWRVAEKFVNY